MMRAAVKKISKREAPKKSDETRARILSTALQLFRKNGYEATTMRDVARGAELALGSAYYYFQSKEALVLAYYAQVQDQHAEQTRTALLHSRDLATRLSKVINGKIDLVRRDRALLGALFTVAANPADPTSIFGAQSQRVRDESIALFVEVLATCDGELPRDLRALLAPVLWMLHMGFLLFFIRDESPKQKKTRKLIDDSLALVMPLVAIASQRLARPFRQRLLALIREIAPVTLF